MLRREPAAQTGALILLPTRELAMQVTNNMKTWHQGMPKAGLVIRRI